MGDFVFNRSLGEVKKLADNVEQNSPAAALLRMHAWVITAADDDANNQNTITQLEALALSSEVSNAGYANQSWEAADITITVNDSTNLVDVDSTDITFTGISSGDVWSDITISYDDDGSDNDTTTLLLTLHDAAVTPNGGDITIQFAAAGWFRASA
ncbi:MAG: hypothetical protein IIC09_08010 [Proteobacteria bacterium]|nr:hypothetical protein [Pseudomonadota bacterium]